MTTQEIMEQFEELGSDQTKKIFLKHGAREPFFGVKVADLKKIVKKVKKNHELSLELYATGNGDAMYLAGLIADEKKISKTDLQEWVADAEWQMISEYTVAWVAAESAWGEELAAEWIESDVVHIAAAGWSTYSSLTSIKSDEALNIPLIRSLLERVTKEIDAAPNRVRYCMNGFMIAVGGYVSELTEEAMKAADVVGLVSVDMNGTACKVPPARPYIQKMVDAGRIGKKRKMARC